MPDSVDVQFTDTITVEVIDGNFSDAMICKAARTSTQGGGADDAERFGLINALMRDRHGSPFEHGWVTFKVHAPIFVWREHHRHRVGFSVNEESGRYKQLDPLFYVPGPQRPIAHVEGSRAMDYDLWAGIPAQRALVEGSIKDSCAVSYWHYQQMLDAGVVKEVARMVLPVNIFSTNIISCNPRSLMHFLSLRQRFTAEEAKFPSKPQYEINLVANGYEMYLKEAAPMIHRSYVENGRVAP